MNARGRSRSTLAGMRPISRLLAAVAVVLLLGGCADDQDRPAVCDDYDSVQASADDLRNANVSENGLSQVRTDVEELRHDLVQFVDSARTELAAVGDAAAWLRETVHRLGTAMADTC
jgi:hypothetical protein